MSARLNNVPERFADLPHGQVTQFERQLEAAGYTPEMLLYFNQNSSEMYELVKSARAIFEDAVFGDPEPYMLKRANWRGVGASDKNGIFVRRREEISESVVRVNVRMGATSRISPDTWTLVARQDQQEVQMKLVSVTDWDTCEVLVRRRITSQ